MAVREKRGVSWVRQGAGARVEGLGMRERRGVIWSSSFSSFLDPVSSSQSR